MEEKERIKAAEDKVRADLFSMQDTKYRDFQARLMPNVDKENIIGVRTPALRKYVKNIAGTEIASDFLKILPHKYYEENNVHGFLIERMKNYDEAVCELDRFLPYVDNWATCDLTAPKVLGKYPEKLISDIERWMSSDMPYTVRYGIEAHMTYFLGDNFKTEYADRIAKIESGEYYVQMMIAWYFATALAKNYDEVIPFIAEHRLSDTTHAMTVRKAVESFRITDEQKAKIKSYSETRRKS